MVRVFHLAVVIKSFLRRSESLKVTRCERHWSEESQQPCPGSELDVKHLPSSPSAADGLQAAVSLKWPDGGSCSLCGIQTQFRPLLLQTYMTAHPHASPHLLLDSSDTMHL